jgi:hypothetical protein
MRSRFAATSRQTPRREYLHTYNGDFVDLLTVE